MSAENDIINLGVCIKMQAGSLGIETEGVPLEGVVVRMRNLAAKASHTPQAVSLPDRETLVNAMRKALDIHEKVRSTFDHVSGHGTIRCGCGWTAEIGSDDSWGSAAIKGHLSDVLAALSTQPAAGEVEAITDEQVMDERELVAAYDIAGRMPQGAMTAEQWSAFAGLYNATGRVVERVESREAARGTQPTELAELFPGTLEALDRLSIRPEVQS